MFRKTDDEPNFWKKFIYGVIGSIVGLVAMGLYWQHVAPVVTENFSKKPEKKKAKAQPGPLDDISLVGKQYKGEESSTEALGRILYRQTTGAAPRSQETRSLLSELVHWGYGLLQGGLYGTLRGSTDGLDLVGGAVYAVGLWLLGDELAVPMLGLQSGPTAASPDQHVNRLGAHLAYGLGTAVTTHLLRRVF